MDSHTLQQVVVVMFLAMSLTTLLVYSFTILFMWLAIDDPYDFDRNLYLLWLLCLSVMAVTIFWRKVVLVKHTDNSFTASAFTYVEEGPIVREDSILN